ncbi:MAG: hypothetical protein ABIO99_11320 [Candidatus Limnocylindria bacterium]
MAWYGWIATSVAEADDTIDRFLGGRQVGDLLRPVTSQVDVDEPISEVIAASRPREVSLVLGRGGLVGAIGPRQIAAAEAVEQGSRCERLMVPVGELPIVPASAPATMLLPLLGRHGFALAWTGGGLGYVEAHDLLDRLLLGADVGRRVEDDDASPSRTNCGPR